MTLMQAYAFAHMLVQLAPTLGFYLVKSSCEMLL